MVHMSIDDFLITFKELTEQETQYSSLFEHPIFAFFQKMHERYNAAFHCYCFGEETESGFTLKDVTRKYRKEFTDNADWLTFGFHGMNKDAVYGDNRGTRVINRDETQAAWDYDFIMENLAEIVGEEALDYYPRIHFFAGTRACCEAWKKARYGIMGLLSADDDRYSYYHNDEQHHKLMEENLWYDAELQLTFRRTNIRLENEPDVETIRNKVLDFEGKEPVIFTHEYFLHSEEMQEKIEACLAAGENRKIKLTIL